MHPTLQRRMWVMSRLCLVLGKSWTRLSTLQANAITPATANQYLESILTFVLWLNLCEPITDHHMLDQTLVTFFDVEFQADSPPSVGSKLLAALLHFKPNLGASIKLAFPLATRALRGWHRLRPATTRQPLPLVALGAMVGRCLVMKEIAIALALLVCFSGYLRPRELTALQVVQLVAREFLAIKERGRRSSDKSLARYKKQGRAQLEVAKLPDVTVNFGAAILQALPAVFHQPQLAAKMWRDHGLASPAPRF